MLQPLNQKRGNMTIPSINGNGKDFNQTIKQNTEQQVKPQTEEKSSVNNPQEVNEKEYSLSQFKKDYADLVETKVVPILSSYEQERKKRLTWAILAASGLSILAIIIFLFVDGRGSGDLFWACIAGAFGSWHLIKKTFEKKVKKIIMPTLMHAIPGFYWQQTPPVTQDDIKNCMIIPFVDKASKTFDDCFVGEYRNVKIAISECEYSIKSNNSSTDILEGVVIKIDMNKNFDGITVIRPRKPGYRDKQDDLKRAKLNEVTLEDPEFDKKFIVYSTDQIEARYLITTSFMERFKAVEKAFDAKFAYCSFHGKSVYIAPHTGKDMFSLCSLVKPIYNKEQFEILFNEFASILALVDHFKLDKKLGL